MLAPTDWKVMANEPCSDKVIVSGKRIPFGMDPLLLRPFALDQAGNSCLLHTFEPTPKIST